MSNLFNVSCKSALNLILARNQTYLYNESTTKKNYENVYPPPPTTQETREYIINKETNIINKPMSQRG